MRTADKYLIIGILCVAVLSFFFIQIFVKQEGERVVVQKNNKVFQVVSLREEQKVRIEDRETGEKNTLEIKDGYAKMIDSNCPDHLCERQKAIKKSGETIVCLPNKVVVEVKEGEESEFDSIAR